MEEILVVDDDRVLLELVKHMLERERLVVHCASSAAEALERLKARTFSLMVTDLNMPGGDGLELSRETRKIAPHMPIIMNSGGLSAQITITAREIGIAKVMAKPLRPNEMLEAIRDLIGKRRLSIPTASLAPRELPGNMDRYLKAPCP